MRMQQTAALAKLHSELPALERDIDELQRLLNAAVVDHRGTMTDGCDPGGSQLLEPLRHRHCDH